MVRAKAPNPARRNISRKPQRKHPSGLGALDTNAVRNAVEEQHAINIIRRLQSHLIELERAWNSSVNIGRSEAVDLLKAIRAAVADLMDEPHGQTDICIASASTTLLDRLIGALEDLDYGRVGEFLRPTEGVAGAAYKFEEKRVREMALVLVSCLHERGLSLRAASVDVSTVLNKHGYNLRGREITAKRIYDLWKNNTK